MSAFHVTGTDCVNTRPGHVCFVGAFVVRGKKGRAARYLRSADSTHTQRDGPLRVYKEDRVAPADVRGGLPGAAEPARGDAAAAEHEARGAHAADRGD